jgi:hypothetical protein
MDTTRNLKDGEVPTEASDSVAEMTEKIVDELVKDFIEELNHKGKTINPDGIDMLKGIVLNRASISLKIKAGVTLDLVEDMKIPLIDMDQASLKRFGGA